eukprot:GAHX01001971.1.p1 GENE.GAHX01001971.1~~GAHX01001971.1.p1  ORF type:complete len:381 (+),score=39.80 GAHX01001971.1:224-1366(+)
MYLFLSLPILIANSIFTSVAFYDIWKHYQFSTFKPRLVLVSAIILSNIPYSVLFIFPDMITTGFLMNDTLCYFYVLLSHFYVLKFFALMALTIFIGLIMFTKYSVARLNKIGWWLNLIVLALFLFLEFVLIFMSGWIPTDFDMDFSNRQHPKRCVAETGFLYSGAGYLSFVCTSIALTAAVVFLIENLRTNKLKKGTSSSRISICFFFFAATNFVAMTEWTLEKIRGKGLVRPAKWIALDIGKIVPACFALIYILTEAWGRLSHLNFGVRKILKITKCRKLFRVYLSDIGAKKAYELIGKWEKLNRGSVEFMDVLDKPGLNKQEANAYIEKFLELEIYGFLSTEAFNDFYLTYNMGGQIEADLAEEVGQQYPNKRSSTSL